MSLEVKIELRHKPRNKDVSVSEVEERIKKELNSQSERVEGVRFSGGHSAGALFLELEGSRKFRVGSQIADSSLDKLVERAVRLAEEFGFADDMSVAYYDVSAK